MQRRSNNECVNVLERNDYHQFEKPNNGGRIVVDKMKPGQLRRIGIDEVEEGLSGARLRLG